MVPSYDSPKELVEALRSRVSSAYEQLRASIREPIAGLMHEVMAHQNLSYDSQIFIRYALHSAESHLRTRKPSEIDGMSWSAFRAVILLAVAKMALHPAAGPAQGALGPLPIPD